MNQPQIGFSGSKKKFSTRNCCVDAPITGNFIIKTVSVVVDGRNSTSGGDFVMFAFSSSQNPATVAPFVTPMTTVAPVSSGLTPQIASQNFCQAGLERCCPSGGYSCGIRYPPIAGARAPNAGQAVSCNIRCSFFVINHDKLFVGFRRISLGDYLKCQT